jgi:hypothetical protein
MNVWIKMESNAIVTLLDAERQLRTQFRNELIATWKMWYVVYEDAF